MWRLICDIQVSSKSERAGLHFYENDGEKLCNDLSDFFYDIRIKKKQSKRFCIIKLCVSSKRKVVVSPRVALKDTQIPKYTYIHTRLHRYKRSVAAPANQHKIIENVCALESI